MAIPSRITSPSVADVNGMGFLTEDRKETGCFLNLDCIENIQVALLSSGKVNNHGFVNQREVNRLAEEYSPNCGSRPRTWPRRWRTCRAATSRSC